MTFTPNPSVSDPDDAYERDDAVIVRAFNWSLAVLVGAAVVGGGVWWYVTRRPQTIATNTAPLVGPDVRQKPRAELPTVKFTNITDAAGIRFTHVDGAYGDKLLPETMGGGCAFFDFDNDGDQDLLLINSCDWPWRKSKDSAKASPDHEKSASKPKTMLYRNDGQGKFEDVSAGSGLDVSCYGIGAAVGDYDNDGLVDVFISTVSAVGPNYLFRNLGGGKFQDVTSTAGVAGDQRNRWSTSCGFVDYDRDGDLDLFVCNYVKWSREIDLAQEFTLDGKTRAYGPPNSFVGAQPYLYRNDGNGRFTDATVAANLHVTNASSGVPVGKSLGLTFVDVDQDGWIDVLVANDTVQNFLYHNRKDGTFEEVAATVGMAFDSAGKARGAMGIDAARFRESGALGVAIGNFANEMSALYVAAPGSIMFTDEAVATGFGPPTRLDLTFGTFFFDYDLDGRLDILSANGHLEEEISRFQSSQQYRQSAKLFWNAGAEHDSEFVVVPPEKTGSDLLTPIVGRGATYADIDGDGDEDLLLTQINGPPLLLRNDQALGRHYVRLKLVGTKSNRDAIGAWIEVQTAGRTQRRQVMPTRSYLSQVELPVTIGLGNATKPDRVTVFWPNGMRQEVTDARVDAVTVVTEAQ